MSTNQCNATNKKNVNNLKKKYFKIKVIRLLQAAAAAAGIGT